MFVTLKYLFSTLMRQERLNFLLTNRIPRRALTLFMGWFSKLQHPVISRLSIGVWSKFAELHLEEAKQASFRSLHDCFIRELKQGARPVDKREDVLTSPCDGIVGACGEIVETRVFQAKGYPYSLIDLIGNLETVEKYRGGTFATIRITSSMYHRFHAPFDCRVRSINYISGDTWNVNPIALKRVEQLFCKNERAVIEVTHEQGAQSVLVVAVAAILVASIRLHCANVLLHLRYRGSNEIECDASYKKGDEMGWFEHGSTIIVLASKGFALLSHVADGTPVKMGQPLMQIPHHLRPQANEQPTVKK